MMKVHPFMVRADACDVRSRRLLRRALVASLSSLVVVVAYVVALALGQNVPDFLYAAWGLQIAAVLGGLGSISAKRSARRWRNWYGEVITAYPRMRR